MVKLRSVAAVIRVRFPLSAQMIILLKGNIIIWALEADGKGVGETGRRLAVAGYGHAKAGVSPWRKWTLS